LALTLAETSGNLETVKVNGKSRYKLGENQSRQSQADLPSTLAETSGNKETVEVGNTIRLGIYIGRDKRQLRDNSGRQNNQTWHQLGEW